MSKGAKKSGGTKAKCKARGAGNPPPMPRHRLGMPLAMKERMVAAINSGPNCMKSGKRSRK